MAKDKKQVEEQVEELDEGTQDLVRDILKSDLPRPVAGFTDRVGQYVVVLDDGSVYSRAHSGRFEPWVRQAPIPGTPADVPEA